MMMGGRLEANVEEDLFKVSGARTLLTCNHTHTHTHTHTHWLASYMYTDLPMLFVLLF